MAEITKTSEWLSLEEHNKGTNQKKLAMNIP